MKSERLKWEDDSEEFRDVKLLLWRYEGGVRRRRELWLYRYDRCGPPTLAARRGNRAGGLLMLSC